MRFEDYEENIYDLDLDLLNIKNSELGLRLKFSKHFFIFNNRFKISFTIINVKKQIKTIGLFLKLQYRYRYRMI